MARTKGSKNKPKVIDDIPENTGAFFDERTIAANPMFNLNSVEPSQTIGQEIASSAILPEDLELERSLQAMITDIPDIEPDPIGAVVVKERPKREMLGEVVEGYKPATTFDEMREQIHMAKQEGCDSIEATKTLAVKVCRDPLMPKVGYFWYHDIKVYIEGSFAEAKKRDSQTIEQRTFGHTRESDRAKEIRAKIRELEAQLDT